MSIIPQLKKEKKRCGCKNRHMANIKSITRGADRVGRTGKQGLERVKSLTFSFEDLETGQRFPEDIA